jgi:poly-gamma-glutamate biosynthesis protein PgsC/CapC
MTPFTPEVATMGLAIGLLLSLICYLVTNLSPGGMITPGWLALVLVEQPERMLVIGAIVLASFLVMLLLQRAVILYGKRLFASVVMVGVFLQLIALLLPLSRSPALAETATLGFIIPGLITYQMLRQPVVPTLGIIAVVSAGAYFIMLSGVLLHLFPGVTPPMPEEISLSPLRLTLGLFAIAGGVVSLTLAARHRRRRNAVVPTEPPHHDAVSEAKRVHALVEIAKQKVPESIAHHR